VLALSEPAPLEHAVAAIVPRRALVDDEPAQVLCSAILVTERALLTAGHCVEDYGRGTLEVTFGPHLGASVEARLASDIVLHPRYSSTQSAYDLAVVWLDAPVSIAPLRLHAGAPSDTWVGTPLRAVGFAQGERREGQLVLEALDRDTLTYGPAPDMTCRGDSGGPVLALIDGIEQVVGVTSAGDPACEAWGIAAQVDEGVDELLALGSAPAAGAIALDAICAQPCTSDEECPGDLLCTDEGRCAVRGVDAGDLVQECADHGECESGLCVALGAAARCLEPCAGGSHAGPSGGCRIAGGRSGPGPSRVPALWGLACALGVLARRRRAATAKASRAWSERTGQHARR
ncbi:MAG: trypsin-like serine protease, partial [Myxococcales bacterium]|nr:trypsin-like serine protease [Myxococcales bacterium]